MIIIISYRKTLKRQAMLFWITYMVLPVVAIIVQAFIYGSTFINIATTMIALILYIRVQVEYVREIKVAAQRVTNEKEALDQLNQMKSELISTVTHETMTPLAVLSGYAELIAEELREQGVNEQTAKDLDKISTETQRIAGLMDVLNSHAQKKQMVKTRFNLIELIDGTVRLYKPILERKNTILTVSVSETLPDIYANANEITQVFFNLLQNARNHTENGEVKIGLSTEKGFVVTTVSDTGSGIAPEILPLAFERGVSGGDGSGVGLFICKEIITSHGGTIEIESKPGGGTTVRFTLPLN
jgi:signal transduction histidine kinase